MFKYLLSLLLFTPLISAAQEQTPRYAITYLTATGPKGSMSIIQVTFVERPYTKEKCEGALQSDRETKGPATVAYQKCVAKLPAPIAPAEKGRAVPKAYVIHWTNTVIPFKPRGMNLVYYRFNPGSERETCARWTTNARLTDPGITCIPPKSESKYPR